MKKRMNLLKKKTAILAIAGAMAISGAAREWQVLQKQIALELRLLA